MPIHECPVRLLDDRDNPLYISCIKAYFSVRDLNGFCCNLQEAARERWVGSTGLRLMQPPPEQLVDELNLLPNIRLRWS